MNKIPTANEHFIFLGMVKDRKYVQELMIRSDLSLLPSLYDNASLTIFENACNHTPMLLIKGSTTAYMVRDNVNGFLAKNNPKKYARKMYEVVTNKKLLTEVSQNAFSQIYVNYETICKQLMQIYVGLIDSKNKIGKKMGKK
jgi:glycosyltransferase involved in cell wall biosynthesis